jgi:hypothetical protein
MSDGAHRIRRLRWRIALGSREEADGLRARLGRTVNLTLGPALERAFDGLAARDDVIHIARLEAAVRVESTDDLEAATADAIRAALTARLAEAGDDRQPGSSERVRRSTVRLSRLESILQYVETGTLPWHAEPETADLGYVRELEETAVSDLTAVLQHLPTTPAEAAVFLFRLLSLLPDSGWLSVVHAVARHRHRPEEPALVEAIERIAVAPERSSGRHARLELAAAIIAGWFAPVEQPIKTAVSSDALRLFDRLALPTRLAKPIDSPRQPADLWRETVRPHHDERAPEGAQVRVPAFYAGLVVLAPFLPRLFAARNVAHPGEQTLTPEALRRAAALLHFAATGEREGHEYELGFIKTLLGVPADRAILFASGILSRGDREEVETVLGDVVEQWYMLKHSSTDGLRQAFLQRRGLLIDTGESWRLRVESAAVDVLLDHLPWTLTTVALPWLSTPIAIDWPRF